MRINERPSIRKRPRAQHHREDYSKDGLVLVVVMLMIVFAAFYIMIWGTR